MSAYPLSGGVTHAAHGADGVYVLVYGHIHVHVSVCSSGDLRLTVTRLADKVMSAVETRTSGML